MARSLATSAAPFSRTDKREGDISAVFTTFSGRKAEPLPRRFLNIKRKLVAGSEEAIQKSWDDLVEVLKIRTEEVAKKREAVSFVVAILLLSLIEKIIPQAEFSDLVAGTVPDKVTKGLHDTGVVVVRNVMPKDQTSALLSDVRQYFGKHPMKGFPSDQDKKVCGL